MRLFLQSLPTYIPDVSIKNCVFRRLYLERKCEVGEGLEGQFAAVLFYCLNTKSCVVTPLPDYQ